MKEDNDCWELSGRDRREKMLKAGPDEGVHDKVCCRGCCWARNGCAVLRLALRMSCEAAEVGAKAVARCCVARSDNRLLASLSLAQSGGTQRAAAGGARRRDARVGRAARSQ